ncbi:MAG TPA: DNA-3-methyladenine glycosylase [Jiangellaceae bacterium]|nr:DNA-3-methyladenine glycosylase [Jiangellaceae bacterium]
MDVVISEWPTESALDRAFFARPPLEVAPELLGCVVANGPVAVRLTEVEAYDGANDPGSHAFTGLTRRNEVMFGPPGHLYVYFTYGMHWCANLVCGPTGEAGAVLLRAGDVIAGADVARARRPAARSDRDLARGPARLASALGLSRTDNGADLCASASAMHVIRGARPDSAHIRTGPRVGLSRAADRPWRFWLDGDPTVSVYRPHAPRRRRPL